MMRLFALLVGAALLAPLPAAAHSHKAKALEIVHPWTRAMADTSVTTVLVSMTIKNGGRAGERLLSASTPLADSVELHGSKSPGGLAIAGGKKLELKRDGPHLLLTGFKRQLEAYESFAMTLVFEKAGPVVIEVVVEELEAPKTH